MPALKPETIILTHTEDDAATVAAFADPDAIPFSDAEWEVAQPKISPLQHHTTRSPQ